MDRKLKSDEVEESLEQGVKFEEDASSDIHLSDDELVHDNIKAKEKKKKKVVNNDEFFEDAIYDENVSFYEMKLSRPLLKAITNMKFIHPTPVQAATIPIALLGKIFKT